MKTITPHLSQRETAIILAALRYYQFAPPKNEYIANIASDDGSFDPLTLMQIDNLAERINTERQSK
jgi:hypothetical protein